jgi:hypothetical protein
MTKCCSVEKTQVDINRRLSVAQMMTMQNDLNNFLFDKTPGAWAANLTKEHYLTAILDEMSEYIGSNITWKWWSNPKAPDTFDLFNSRIEIIDIVHFYLSIMIMKRLGFQTSCDSTPEFMQFDDFYVGTDKNIYLAGISLLSGTNNLNHSNFISLFTEMTADKETVFDMIDVLDLIISAGGMSSELASAFYVAKATLNEYRFTNKDYIKVIDGIEDNVRMKTHIDAFVADTNLTLNDLKQLIIDEFFEIPLV